MSVQCGTNAETGGMQNKPCAVRITHCHWTSCHDPLLRRGMPFFLLQRGVLLRDVTTIDTLLRSRDLALLGLSPIVSRAHRARQRQGPLQLRKPRTADLQRPVPLQPGANRTMKALSVHNTACSRFTQFSRLSF